VVGSLFVQGKYQGEKVRDKGQQQQQLLLQQERR
jgi:hypothetical protein